MCYMLLTIYLIKVLIQLPVLVLKYHDLFCVQNYSSVKKSWESLFLQHQWMSSWYKKITEFLCDWASWYLGQVNGGSWEGMVQPLIILWWTLVNFYKQLSEILWMKYKHILFFNFCIFRDKFLQFNFEIEMFPLFLQYIAILFHPKKLKVFFEGHNATRYIPRLINLLFMF